MKKILILTVLITLASCNSFIKDEARKTVKSNTSSSRINSSESNSKEILKELDE